MTAEQIAPHLRVRGLRCVAIDGPNVTVAFVDPTSAGQRGTTLLDLEDVLRVTWPKAVVWHEPLGDRSSLRNLRGIEVKT